MANVAFEIVHRFDAPAQAVWDALIDWTGHAQWVPLTRVVVDPGDPDAVGATFTAWTGIGPLALKDRMRVTRLDWDPAAATGACEVEKLGPILTGRAGFVVTPAGSGAEMRWTEDVTVPVVPQVLGPALGKLGSTGLSFGMRRLSRSLDKPPR
jgi:hypothetical protein